MWYRLLISRLNPQSGDKSLQMISIVCIQRIIWYCFWNKSFLENLNLDSYHLSRFRVGNHVLYWLVIFPCILAPLSDPTFSGAGHNVVRILKNTEIYGDIPEGDNSSTVDTNDVITATPGLSSWIIISARVSDYYVIDIDPLQHMCDDIWYWLFQQKSVLRVFSKQTLWNMNPALVWYHPLALMI